MAKDPELQSHKEWLNYLQDESAGLVVAPAALLAAQAHVNKNIVPQQQRFLEHVANEIVSGNEEVAPVVTDVAVLLRDVFDWEVGDLVGGSGADPLPESLEVTLAEYNETLRPTFAVPEPEGENASPWLLLIKTWGTGTPLDEVYAQDERRWQASPHARFERLLRETQVPIGLLTNGTHLRLVYAPRGETSGYLTFPVKAMSEVAGRSIFAALHMLLSAARLFSMAAEQRLPETS